MSSQPDIVWITLESTRADHTPLAGYDRDTTPNLRRIAEAPAGRSFSECFSHGIWTLASTASILTGTYPSYHGTGVTTDVLPEEIETVPERLRRLGYHTVGLSPNSHLSAGTDLDRGFDEFDWFSPSTLLDAAGPRTLFKYLLNVRRHGPGLTTDTVKHNTGYLINDVAKRTIRSFADADGPGFLYVHHGDPHHPYYPPRSYFDRYLDAVATDEAAALALRHHDRLNELIAEGCPLDDEEWTALLALYDASIAYADDLVGTLFDYARERLDDVVFVVTADHGELFGEGGMLAHKVVVDDAVCHVPLVVHGLDALADHDGEMVQHADVVRTLLGALGGDTDGLHGYDLRHKRREHSLIQRGGDRARRNLEAIEALDPGFDASRYHDGTLHALRTSRFKYLRSDDGAELFELPDEERDRTGRYPDVAAELDATLDDWLERYGTPVSADDREGKFTNAMRDQLADLGYLVE